MKKIFNHFEKESWLVIIFIIGSIWIVNPYFYSLLAATLFAAMFFSCRNLIKSTWLTFIPVYLFYRAIYYTSPVIFQTGFLDDGINNTVITFFVSYSDPMLVLLLVLLFIRQKRSVNPKNNNGVPGGMAAAMNSIVILGVISSWFSKMPEVSYFYLLQLIKFFVVFLISPILTYDKKIAKATLEIIFLFVLFNSLLIVLQKANGGPLGLPIESPNLFTKYGRFADESPGLYRPGGITTGPNEMATAIGLTLPMLLSLGITKNKFNRMFIWICLGASAAALMFTAARAVWILMLIILPVIYLRIRKTTMYSLPAPAAKYGRIALVGCGLLFMPMFLQRILSIEDLIKPGGGAVYRIRHLIAASELMKSHPVGVGMNVFQYAIAEEFDPEYIFYDSTPAHNILAEIGADFGATGIPLFLLLFYFMVKSSQAATKIKNPVSIGVLYGLIVYMTLLQVHPWLFERSASSLFWLIGGYYVKSN